MKRRFFLGLAPALVVARAASSSVTLPTIQERIDHHAAEILGMVREIAPPEAGAVSVILGENWHPHAALGRWWYGTSDSFSWHEHERGAAMWVQHRTSYLNPESLSWS